MTSEDNESQEAQAVEVVEEEEIKTQKEKNAEKIQALIKELDKIGQKKGPDIRICPKCFSLRIKKMDTLGSMGIQTAYPVYICQDCGWRSKTWLYLDRTMKEEERNHFLSRLIEEDTKS
ncbi:MAG: hypothetical protein ACTSO7_12815 [Candidatus Heimdallarchaeota archaeon]